MRRSRLLPLLFVALTLSGCAGIFPFLNRGTGPHGPISAPAVRHGELENGLRYFVRANPEPEGRAELRLVVNAGSVLEDEDQRGLAHFVEHMAFNGTRSFSGDEIVNYLETIGMRFGPDVNAYTSFDETVYMLTLPTDSAGVLEKGLWILEEWASGIAFDSAQVEQERQVVIEEWRLGRGANSRLQTQQFPTLTQRSRYAERLPIGTHESLTSFDLEAARRFYEDWYRPELMAIVAVGDFDASAVEAEIRSRFATIPASIEPRERREYPVPRHRETLVSVASDPELTSGQVSVYLKRPPRPWRNEEGYRRWVVESLASAMLVNRLNELTQRRESPFLDVSSFQGRFVRTLSTYALNARIRDDRVEEGLERLLLEIERAARHGFTATELEREQREMLRIMEQRYAERRTTTSGSFAADYVSYFLYGGRIQAPGSEYAIYERLIPAASLRQVNSVARDWTQPANRVILVSIPDRPDTTRPDEEALARLIESVPRQAVVPYRDSLSAAALVSRPPTPGEVLAESEIPEIGATIWELSNGIQVVLKATDFREDEVLLAGRSPGGTSLVDDEDFIPALTAAAVVQSGGLGELSANDLRKHLAGTVAGVGADIGEMYEGVSGAASPRDLATLFQLVHLKFTAPRPDSTAFLAYQEQAKATLANRSASPEVAFQDSLRAILTQNHPRARPPSVEIFDQLDMERSFAIYRDRFADASDFTFFLVGAFELDEVRPLVERYLASLPALYREEVGRDLGIRPPAGVVKRTVRHGVEPRAATQIVFSGDFAFSRDNALALQRLADVLRLRLREVLREQLGGTYGVSVRGTASGEPAPRYQFSIGFGADPGRVEELTAAVFAEIDAIREAGPTDDEVARVREAQYRSREVDLRQNHFWLGQMLTYHQHGWRLAEIPTLARRAEELTVDSVRQAAVDFLDPENYIQVSLLPQTGAIAIP